MGFVIPVEFRVDWGYMIYAVYPVGVRYNPTDRLLAPCLQIILQHETEPSSVIRVLFEGLVGYRGLIVPTDQRLQLEVTFSPGLGYEGDYFIRVDEEGGMVANRFTWQQLRAVEQP